MSFEAYDEELEGNCDSIVIICLFIALIVFILLTPRDMTEPPYPTYEIEVTFYNGEKDTLIHKSLSLPELDKDGSLYVNGPNPTDVRVISNKTLTYKIL